MKRQVILSIAACALTAGCQGPRIESRDQWLAESQRTFQGRDREQVLRAAEAVLQSISPGNVTFLHTPNSLEATRQWFVTIIIASVAGRDKFTLVTESAPNGTSATLRIDRRVNNGNSSIEENLSTVATYRLFFNWVGYALGKERKWISCDDAAKELGLSEAGNGINNAMCGPAPASRGFNPVQPRPEWVAVSNTARPAAVSNRDQLRPLR